MLAGATATFASMKDVPEFEVSLEESEDFMKKAQAVMRHYAVETTQKGIDFIALFGCSFAIVSTRIAAYSLRKKTERSERNGSNDPYRGATVVPMPNAGIHITDPEMMPN